MGKIETTAGESAWNLRHGAGHIPAKQCLFGCLVDFLPKPDADRAMPKFQGCGNQGFLVGYCLQHGGKWGRDYQVFPFTYFRDFEYDRPRGIRDLIPIITQEIKMTDSEPTIPLRER